MNARIWLGLHFRKAMTDGNLLGHSAAEAVISEHVRPGSTDRRVGADRPRPPRRGVAAVGVRRAVRA